MPELELSLGEEAKEMLEKMRIFGKPIMRYSNITGRYYLTFEPGIELSDGCCLTGVAEHRDTPEEAVVAFYSRLRSERKKIVIHAMSDDRREYVYSPFKDDFVPYTGMDTLSVEL